MAKEKKFPQDYDFSQMVDALAGDALISLIHGMQWSSIMHVFAMGVAQWAQFHQNKKVK